MWQGNRCAVCPLGTMATQTALKMNMGIRMRVQTTLSPKRIHNIVSDGVLVPCGALIIRCIHATTRFRFKTLAAVTRRWFRRNRAKRKNKKQILFSIWTASYKFSLTRRAFSLNSVFRILFLLSGLFFLCTRISLRCPDGTTSLNCIVHSLLRQRTSVASHERW